MEAYRSDCDEGVSEDNTACIEIVQVIKNHNGEFSVR